MGKDFYLLIVAAGKGQRIGLDIPKQYLTIAGKPLLSHTLDAFGSIKGLKQICLVVNPDDKKHYECILKKWDRKPLITCAGGNTRQESVRNGLEAFALQDDDIILIHDAARPFIREDDISALLGALEEHKGASLAFNITDTCRNVSKTNIAQDTVSRENLWALQTPQAFAFKDIKQAHDLHAIRDPNKKYTDDTDLLSDMINCDVKLVASTRHNFKITTWEDIQMAEKILSDMPLAPRVGMGYDVHGFDNNIDHATHIRLCGVDIKYDRKLKGHSDADVGLHALCDAIYGAIGAGDIGMHFPPSNQDYKDMDSAKFLEHAMSLLREKGGVLVNADVTLICEEPKIGPYKEQMTSRMAQIMHCSPACINLKATTTEKLGFEGRKEGISAQAVASVLL